MGLALLPLLAAQRELLEQPRSVARFRSYLNTMLDDHGEMALPLSAFNPMSKPHVAALLDTLIAADAEGLAREVLTEAATRLGTFTPDLRVGIVLVDDALGGWTNRYLSDLNHRIDNAGELKRRFATAYVWSGEEPSLAGVRTELCKVVYRAAYKQQHGYPKTLAQILIHEGLASRFAAEHPTSADLALLPQLWPLIAQHRHTTATPPIFTCLYGDEAAISVGYPPLGVPAWGGLAVATALAARWEPIAALTTLPVLPETFPNPD